MAKHFGDVFPTLKLDEETTALLEAATVERITATKRRDFLRIFLESPRLITKDIIFYIEKEIRQQLFPGAVMTVKIRQN